MSEDRRKAQMCILEEGIAQIGIHQVGPTQVSIIQNCFTEINDGQVGSPEVEITQVYPAEICSV